MTPWERFAQAARDAGCPPEQVRRFVAGGYVPQPKQLEFHALARMADAPDGPTEIGFGGARGPGKSHAIMAQLIHDDAQRQPGLKALFLRSIAGTVRESFEDLITKVCPQYWDAYQPGNGRMVLPNGSRIVLGGFRTAGDIAKYLGLEYDVIAIEEATLLLEAYYTPLMGSLRTTNRTGDHGCTTRPTPEVWGTRGTNDALSSRGVRGNKTGHALCSPPTGTTPISSASISST